MIRIIKTLVFLLAMALVVVAGYKAINYKLDTLRTARMQASPVTAELRQKQMESVLYE